VVTTFKEELASRFIFCSISEAVKNHPISCANI